MEMKSWIHKDIRDHLIACSIAKSDIDLSNLQNAEDKELTLQIRVLKRTIEKYANGGLKLITELAEEDPDGAEDDLFFIRMLS